MPVTAAEALLALEGAAETWGRRRKTPGDVDLLGTHALTGCALEVLGLRDLIPQGGRERRAALWHVAQTAPELGRALGAEGLEVLNYAQRYEHAGHAWNHCIIRTREHVAEMAVQAEAVRPDLTPVRAEQVHLPDSVQVVTLRRPRTDDNEPCAAASPAVQLVGGLAVSFGCGDVADHPSENHAWVITW